MDVGFPLVEIEGPPRERGIQYGEKAGERIHRGAEIYRKVMAGYGCSWEKALELANQFAPIIKENDVALYDELEGIAAGAKIEIASVIIINGRSELMQGFDWDSEERKKNISLDDGCTSVLAMPEATQTGRLIHSQNWDWHMECVETSIVLRVIPEKGPTILTFVEAGGLARCGMNSAGVAITANGLESNLDYGRSGIPLSIIRRRVLQSEKLYGALAAIIRTPRAVSNNMLLSSIEEGGTEAIDLETSPEDVYPLYPKDGLFTHSNHFESQVALANLKDTGLKSMYCSLYRSRRSRALLEPKIGNITIDDIKAVLADQFGAPRGICRSPVRSSRGNHYMTVASIIMDTRAQEMYVCGSPHNNSQYFQYSVQSGAEQVPVKKISEAI